MRRFFVPTLVVLGACSEADRPKPAPAPSPEAPPASTFELTKDAATREAPLGNEVRGECTRPDPSGPVCDPGNLDGGDPPCNPKVCAFYTAGPEQWCECIVCRNASYWKCGGGP